MDQRPHHIYNAKRFELLAGDETMKKPVEDGKNIVGAFRV